MEKAETIPEQRANYKLSQMEKHPLVPIDTCHKTGLSSEYSNFNLDQQLLSRGITYTLTTVFWRAY